jgi:hypothetical protein
MRSKLFALLVGAVASGAPLSAHHSFPAHYFEQQTVRVEGDLLEFEYRSPHAWVHVMARDQNGQMQKFSAESAGPARLAQRGITAETLKPGDHVIITGAPGRNASERRVHLKSIERPADGWAWRGGGGPR